MAILDARKSGRRNPDLGGGRPNSMASPLVRNQLAQGIEGGVGHVDLRVAEVKHKPFDVWDGV